MFLHYLKGGRTVRVSVASDGGQGVDSCPSPFTGFFGVGAQFSPYSGSTLTGHAGGIAPARALSADGRYVVFISHDANLVPNDRNCDPLFSADGDDVFVHDLRTGRTTRVSVGPDGREIDLVTGYLTGPFSWSPTIS